MGAKTGDKIERDIMIVERIINGCISSITAK